VVLNPAQPHLPHYEHRLHLVVQSRQEDRAGGLIRPETAQVIAWVLWMADGGAGGWNNVKIL